jgi:AraC-like DNA-binding protein
MSDRLSFNTDMLPQRDRFPAFCEEFIRGSTGLDITTQDQLNFHAAIDLQCAGTIALTRLSSSSPAVFSRTPELVQDGNDALCLVLVRRGGMYKTQHQHDQKLEAGEDAIFDEGYPGTLSLVAPTRALGLRIPRHKLVQLAPRFTRFSGIMLDKNPAALRLLLGYLDAAESADLPGSGRIADLYEDHIMDLIALAIGATRDAVEIARGRGVRAARLLAIKRDIMASLGDSALSLTAVAARHGITPRYVNMLFDSEGTTFTAFVIEQRLARAYSMLADPRYLSQKISAISHDCGFHDLSWFHRTFRRRYRATPSDIREATINALKDRN